MPLSIGAGRKTLPGSHTPISNASTSDSPNWKQIFYMYASNTFSLMNSMRRTFYPTNKKQSRASRRYLGSHHLTKPVMMSGTSLGLRDEEETEEAEEIYYDPAERGFGEFYVCASFFWVDHFKVCTPDLLPDISDIVKLCRASSKRLQNWIRQNCRPDCTITPKFGYDSLSQDPLNVVS